jgi:hypothetical protein
MSSYLSSILVTVAVASSVQVRGEAPRPKETCLTYDSRYEEAPLMRVKAGIAAAKMNFRKEAKACPADSTACPWRQKAYLVPGDVAFVGPELRGFRCAYYGTANGDIVAGFLPTDALEVTPDGGNLDAAFLSGTWAHLGLNPITFTSADGKAVHAKGKGIWHGLPGVVHSGSFSATAEPKGDSIEFRESDGGLGCEVKIGRRGPYLVVSDNSYCGGMNVRFQGIYVKRTK